MTLDLALRIRSVLALAPESPALEYKQRWYSWAEMSSLMTQTNDLLSSAGLGEGAPIGILLRNRPAQLCTLLQVLASRRCVVTLNPFQSAEKIARDLEATQIGALIADEQDWQAPALQAAAQTKGCLGLSVNSGDKLTIGVQPGLGITVDPATLPDLRETAILMLSSGTTGPAKRIALPYAKLEASLSDAAHYESGNAISGLTLKASPAMLTIPLVHIGGMYFAVAAITSARPIVIQEKFSVLEWSQAVATYRPKMVSLPPTAIRMILDADVAKSDIESLLAIRTGSAPLEPALQIEFETRYNIPLLDAYGATEFAGAVAGWSLRDHKEFAQQKRGSVGRAQPGCEVRIIDMQTDQVLGNNNIGLLEVRSAQVDASRWVRTTDLAEIDDDGFIFIRGRSDSAIIRGGFKVLPRDVEHVLREHPAIKEICVVGLPDPRLGAVPVAALEVRPEFTLDESQLTAFAREKLVAYQVPVRWLLVDNLPRTPSLKISQHEVRQLFTAPDSITQTAI
ncbi:class I adenylate-forming enzyme family protein [Pseudomonas umsongensis]|uniref:class I adenylate-forming enzyme family protein n=1 Tax=Pseudomonas umsongensis TaxID=198618 RepID=UPI00200B7F18|nr:class I adenylate-forming enzyme family protein [Pseudomonas umsongensis]MCK8682735.1 acyl--CoA ligase [Pseudomonas umsongensis]